MVSTVPQNLHVHEKKVQVLVQFGFRRVLFSVGSVVGLVVQVIDVTFKFMADWSCCLVVLWFGKLISFNICVYGLKSILKLSVYF